jgi:hypothetical protein
MPPHRASAPRRRPRWRPRPPAGAGSVRRRMGAARMRRDVQRNAPARAPSRASRPCRTQAANSRAYSASSTPTVHAELVQVVRHAEPEPTTSTPSSAQRPSAWPRRRPGFADRATRQRNLEHRHVGVGEEVAQRHPGAVVQAPRRRRASRRRAARRACAQPASGAPGAGYWMSYSGREAAEVVHRLGRGRGGNAHAARHPVRREDQHGLGLGQGGAQRAQLRARPQPAPARTWGSRGRRRGRDSVHGGVLGRCFQCRCRAA